MNPKQTPLSLTLDPYTGPWGATQAAHLLRRTMFGATSRDISLVKRMVVSDAVDSTLLAVQTAVIDPPLVWYHSEIGGVVDGQTWVNLDYDKTHDFDRSQSLVDWHVNLMLTQGISILEKMSLFWHNHFSCGTTTVGDARYMYKQSILIRNNALGNYKSLVKSITLDPAMLRYLSGNQNVASAPNENYGRELQELFTIGKGPEVAAGDYTTYTEADVKAAAHVLTGWSDDPKTVSTVFTAANHDPSDKQFSARYGNQVIKGGSDQAGAERELDDLLTMIFSQPETAKYICRKIFRWFVDYVIDDTIEQNVIAPLAQTLVTNNFEIKPVLSQLLKSSLFFDAAYNGCIIKTPLDLVIGTMRTLSVGLPLPDNITDRYNGFLSLYETSSNMLMTLLEPPNVAGWPEYYEAPQYHELWINSGTLDARIKFLDDIVTNQYIIVGQFPLPANLDPTAVAKLSSNPSDSATLVSDLATLFYPNPLTADQLTTLVDVLIPGLPTYEWTNEWTGFIADPTNAVTKSAVSTKLTNLIKYMVELAEYQLM
jgi:uncharacterized protein (DUF1800 family)